MITRDTYFEISAEHAHIIGLNQAVIDRAPESAAGKLLFSARVLMSIHHPPYNCPDCGAEYTAVDVAARMNDETVYPSTSVLAS